MTCFVDFEADSLLSGSFPLAWFTGPHRAPVFDELPLIQLILCGTLDVLLIVRRFSGCHLLRRMRARQRGQCRLPQPRTRTSSSPETVARSWPERRMQSAAALGFAAFRRGRLQGGRPETCQLLGARVHRGHLLAAGFLRQHAAGRPGPGVCTA